MKAYRDKSKGKLDFEACLSPLVLEHYAEYIKKHRKQANGKYRDDGNWQLGLDIKSYQKSLVRHLFQAWGCWRGNEVYDNQGEKVDLLDALYGVMFNVQGLLFELLRKK